MYFLSKMMKKFGALLECAGLSFDLNKQERNKILWLTLAFFCLIGSYTILK